MMMTDALFGPLPKSPRDLGEFFVSEIQPLLETLRGLPESQGPLNDRPPKDHLLEDLTRWLCREGVSLDGLRLEADAGLGSKGMGSGVFATKSFGTGALVCVVPRRLMLTSEPLCSGDALGDPLLRSMPTLVLTLRLLQETLLAQSSFYWPYIQSLPSASELKLPLYYSSKELMALKGSHAQYEAHIILIHHLREFHHLQALLSRNPAILPQSINLSYELFTWAKSIVLTRQNRIPSRKQNETQKDTSVPSLIPFFDLFNHRPGTIATEYNAQKDQSETRLEVDAKAGDQLFMAYGPRSNADFLLYSGFVDSSHCLNDEVKLWMGLGSGLGDPQRRVLELMDYPLEGFYTLSVGKHYSQEPIFSYLCLVFTEDLEFLRQAASGTVAGGFPIEAEKKAKNWLAARCRLMVHSLKRDITNLKEDTAALSEQSNLDVIRDFKACELAVYELKLKQVSSES